MRQQILIILGVLFAINVFFRVRVMKLMKQIKEKEIRIEPTDFTNSSNFDRLITETYPEYRDLLIKYRQEMMIGLSMIILVVITLTFYFIIDRNSL